MGWKIELEVVLWSKGEAGGKVDFTTYRKLVDSDDIKEVSEISGENGDIRRARVVMRGWDGKKSKVYFVTNDYSELREAWVEPPGAQRKW